jgi:hypothetical protein
LNDLVTATATLFSVIVVALSADLISLTVPGGFAGLALATGLLTLLTIIPAYVQPRGRVFPASLNERCFFPHIGLLSISTDKAHSFRT